MAPGKVSPWYQVRNLWAEKEAGLWAIPDIGTQVLVSFPYNNMSRGVILGCVYDEKHRPPEPSTENYADSTLWQTKNHRLEFIDVKGGEEIRIETAKGKIRIIISKNGGISIINEIGDIHIKCRKLIIESDDVLDLDTKDLVFSCGDFDAEAEEALIECDDKVDIKGDLIKLESPGGATAEGKQIAMQGDTVMGFDVHNTELPSASGTSVVPLPHPFIGKLTNRLSPDVRLNDHPVATEGSVASHNRQDHMMLPGSIKFVEPARNEGTITGDTVESVKVNGRPVAVIGSTVTTCNDVNARNNSKVYTPWQASSFPMPKIINPANSEEWLRDQQSKGLSPKFTSVKWSTTKVNEGEEAELTARVQDIADGNTITLQVFAQGAEGAGGVALAQFPLEVKGGNISAKWSYHFRGDTIPPEANPKFIFIAHSAWCGFEKSENTLEVELVRPQMTKAEWRDAEEKPASRGLVGETLKLVAETKDMEGSVTFCIYDDNGRSITNLNANIKGGKAETEWTYHWDGTPLKEKPKFKFEVIGQRCKKVKSSEIEISGKINLHFIDEDDIPFVELPVKIEFDTETLEENTSSEGIIEKEDYIPQSFVLSVNNEDYKRKIASKISISENEKEYEMKCDSTLLLKDFGEIFIRIKNNEKDLSE